MRSGGLLDTMAIWKPCASADLTQVLRLDPRAVVEPLENDHLQITLIDPTRGLDDLIPIGLTNRPELASQQALVQAAQRDVVVDGAVPDQVERLEHEREQA